MNIETITLDQFADLYEVLEAVKTRDTGGMIIHQGKHPKLGAVVLVNDASGNSFLITAA